MASETAPALGEGMPLGMPMSADGKILDAKAIIGYRDESMERIERVLLESLSELVQDGHDVEFENQKREKFYSEIEALDMLHVKDGQDLFDVSIWIKHLSEGSEIDERAAQKHMQAWATEEADTVSQSLSTAKGLQERMKKISESLVTTARTEHTTLKNKLKEQYFAFQAQLTDLVANLEEEETKRRSLAMTNIMLKQKMQLLKMRGAAQQNSNKDSGRASAAGDADDNGDAGGQDTKAALAQRNLDIAQLRARLEEQRDQLNKLKATNLKQGAALMNLKDAIGSSEEAKKQAAEKAREEGSEKEVLLLKLLQHSRDALDRKPYPDADAFDAGVSLSLGSLPREITKLYKILDEYSQKLERLQNHVMGGGEAEMKREHESSQEMISMRKRIQEMQNALEQQQQKISQQASMIEKAKKMRRGGLGDSDGSDLEEEYVDPVTGQVVKKKSTKQALKAICSRMAQFHNSVVDDIIGVGSSSLTKPKMDNLKKAATDAAGSENLVQAVCGALEEYLTKYWAESGIKSMAENIKTVTQHNAKQASAKFEHLSELQKLAGMINDATQKGGKFLGGLMERYAEQMRRWELRKAQLIQERAEAIMKCMSSVLHVVTLNIGIKIAPREQQTIIHTLQQSCVGRGNAFWPKQKAATEIAAIDSIPPSRAQTAASGRKSNGLPFSVTRLPLHRMADEGSHRDPTSWRSSRGADSFRLETAGGDSLDRRSPRNLLGSPGALRASARKRGDSPTTHVESRDSGSSACSMSPTCLTAGIQMNQLWLRTPVYYRHLFLDLSVSACLNLGRKSLVVIDVWQIVQAFTLCTITSDTTKMTRLVPTMPGICMCFSIHKLVHGSIQRLRSYAYEQGADFGAICCCVTARAYVVSMCNDSTRVGIGSRREARLPSSKDSRESYRTGMRSVLNHAVVSCTNSLCSMLVWPYILKGTPPLLHPSSSTAKPFAI